MSLLAGAAAVDITPPVGGLMDGYGARSQPSQGVHDPLFTRALVMDYGGGASRFTIYAAYREAVPLLSHALAPVMNRVMHRVIRKDIAGLKAYCGEAAQGTA